MISLKEPDTPYTLDLPYGIQITVTPLTTSSMLTAQAIARHKVGFQGNMRQEAGDVGLTPENEDKEAAEGNAAFQRGLLQELATRHIINWQGVEKEGQSAPLTAENITAVMELYPVGETFLAEFTLKQMLLNAAKNGLGASAHGTTHPKGVPTTVKGVSQNVANPSSAPTPATPPAR